MKRHIFRIEKQVVNKRPYVGQVYAFTISQSLTLNQSNNVDYAFYTENVSQSLSVVQTLKSLSYQLSSSLSISQSVSHNSDATYSFTTNLINLRQALDRVNIVPISQSLVLSQLEVDQKTIAPVPDPFVNIVQTVALAYTHAAFGSNVLRPFQNLSRVVVKPRSASSSLVISQALTVNKVISQSVTTAVHLVDSSSVQKITSPTNALTISQTVVKSVIKNRSIAQTLHLARPIILVQSRINYSLSNTLVFKAYHNIGSTLVPNLIVTKSNANCCKDITRVKTVLHGKTFDIVLPNPEYGDSETPLTLVKMKRTISGEMYTYVRKNVARKLKYKFILNRKKAYELRQFLFENMSEKVTLHNFKGEIWIVNIINNPIEFIADKNGDPPCGELYSCELDLQGIKIN